MGMSPKSHGTTAVPVQKNLRWGVDRDTADRICSFNRHYAEYAGYWKKTNFLSEVKQDGETTYYDSVSGKPLFVAPRGRTFEAFLKDGEAISVDGTHLGHNLPDRNGNRYCINLVSVAGNPVEQDTPEPAILSKPENLPTAEAMPMDGSKTVQEMIDGNKVMVFSKSYCPFCDRAKGVLKEGGVDFSVIELDQVANGDQLHDDLKAISK